MIELRWYKELGRPRRLEYRTLQMGVDASGALSPIGAEWSEWKIVPDVDDIYKVEVGR